MIENHLSTGNPEPTPTNESVAKKNVFFDRFTIDPMTSDVKIGKKIASENGIRARYWSTYREGGLDAHKFEGAVPLHALFINPEQLVVDGTDMQGIEKEELNNARKVLHQARTGVSEIIDGIKRDDWEYLQEVVLEDKSDLNTNGRFRAALGLTSLNSVGRENRFKESAEGLLFEMMHHKDDFVDFVEQLKGNGEESQPISASVLLNINVPNQIIEIDSGSETDVKLDNNDADTGKISIIKGVGGDGEKDEQGELPGDQGENRDVTQDDGAGEIDKSGAGVNSLEQPNETIVARSVEPEIQGAVSEQPDDIPATNGGDAIEKPGQSTEEITAKADKFSGIRMLMKRLSPSELIKYFKTEEGKEMAKFIARSTARAAIVVGGTAINPVLGMSAGITMAVIDKAHGLKTEMDKNPAQTDWQIVKDKLRKDADKIFRKGNRDAYIARAIGVVGAGALVIGTAEVSKYLNGFNETPLNQNVLKVSMRVVSGALSREIGRALRKTAEKTGNELVQQGIEAAQITLEYAGLASIALGLGNMFAELGSIALSGVDLAQNKTFNTEASTSTPTTTHVEATTTHEPDHLITTVEPRFVTPTSTIVDTPQHSDFPDIHRTQDFTHTVTPIHTKEALITPSSTLNIDDNSHIIHTPTVETSQMQSTPDLESTPVVETTPHFEPKHTPEPDVQTNDDLDPLNAHLDNHHTQTTPESHSDSHVQESQVETGHNNSNGFEQPTIDNHNVTDVHDRHTDELLTTHDNADTGTENDKFITPDGEVRTLVFGPEGGTIGLVQQYLHENYQNWNGNMIGTVGYFDGKDLLDLAASHSNLIPVTYPGDTIQSFLERYDVPQTEIDAFFNKLNSH